MSYKLIWESQYGVEEIDEFGTLQEAREMRAEYMLAYHNEGTISIEHDTSERETYAKEVQA